MISLETLKFAYHLFYIYYPFIIFKMIADWRAGRGDQTHIEWSTNVCKYFHVDFEQIGTIPRSDTRRTIYLFNHRTTADFFLHDVISEGTGSILSRYLVGMIFWTALFFGNSVWFFRRNSIKNYQQFYEWLDRQFERSPRKNLIIYPEGHRSQGRNYPSPLKTGMLRYAYSRRLQVQIGITFGNDRIIQQSPPRVDLSGARVFYSWDYPIRAEEFGTEQQFLQCVKTRFANKFYQTLQQFGSIQAKL